MTGRALVPGAYTTASRFIVVSYPAVMDFLKSAVASAIVQGLPFPYSFGDKVDIDESIWTLFNGTKRASPGPLQSRVQLPANNAPQEDGSDCSIFSFDIPANKGRLALAKNALKKLRTLRHPGVIKVLDTVEVRRAQLSWAFRC